MKKIWHTSRSTTLICFLGWACTANAKPSLELSEDGCDHGRIISFDAEAVKANLIKPSIFRHIPDSKPEMVYSNNYQIIIIIPNRYTQDILRFSSHQLNCKATISLGEDALETEIISQIFPASTINLPSKFIDVLVSKDRFSFEYLHAFIKMNKKVKVMIQ